MKIKFNINKSLKRGILQNCFFKSIIFFQKLLSDVINWMNITLGEAVADRGQATDHQDQVCPLQDHRYLRTGRDEAAAEA